MTTWIDNFRNFSDRNRSLVTLLVGVIAFMGIKKIIKTVRRKIVHGEIENRRVKVRSERDLKLQKFVFDHRKLLTNDIQMKILQANLSELVYMIRHRKVSCAQVLL